MHRLGDQKVGRARGKLHHRGQRHRPVGVVGRDGHTARFGHSRDLAHLQNPAAVTDVGLDHIHQPVAQQRPKAPARVVALARSQGDLHCVAHARQHLIAVRGHRLLEEHEVERLQRLRDADGGLGAKAPMPVHRDVHAGADGLPRGGHARHGMGQPRRGDVEVFVAKGVKLHAREALRGRGRCGLSTFVGGGIGAGPSIGADGVAHGPAPQLIDGHVEQLACDVPQRLLDAADGGEIGDAFPAGDHLPLAPEQFDGARVLAHKDALHLLQRAQHGEFLALQRGLAHALHALIGIDLDEDVIAGPEIYHEGANVGDLHGMDLLARAVDKGLAWLSRWGDHTPRGAKRQLAPAARRAVPGGNLLARRLSRGRELE